MVRAGDAQDDSRLGVAYQDSLMNATNDVIKDTLLHCERKLPSRWHSCFGTSKISHRHMFGMHLCQAE